MSYLRKCSIHCQFKNLCIMKVIVGIVILFEMYLINPWFLSQKTNVKKEILNKTEKITEIEIVNYEQVTCLLSNKDIINNIRYSSPPPLLLPLPLFLSLTRCECTFVQLFKCVWTNYYPSDWWLLLRLVITLYIYLQSPGMISRCLISAHFDVTRNFNYILSSNSFVKVSPTTFGNPVIGTPNLNRHAKTKPKNILINTNHFKWILNTENNLIQLYV